MTRIAFGLLLWLCASLALSADPPDYTITDVGPCGGQILAVNDHGQVAGSYSGGQLVTRGFLWTQGKRADLGLLPQYTSTIVCAINNRGQIAGNLDATTDGAVLTIVSHAFLWKRGKLHDLTAPSGDEVSVAAAMNDGGQVVGYASAIGRPSDDNLSLTEHHAFVCKGGVMTDLGPGEAKAINTGGQIVGETPGPFYLEATLWDHGRVIKLGIHGIAQAINNSGQILIDTGNSSPVLWQHGHLRFLPVPPGSVEALAHGINDRGQIIGTVSVGQNSQAALWQGNRVLDLNTRISPHSGWVLTDATGINNRGQIVGHGFFHGKESAFLLTPLRKG
jgi:probable HAF family extracellular repeat protein